MVVRDMAREMLHQETRKDGSMRRDVGRARNATMAYGTEA
jgi:hypothetical protein